MSRVAIEGTAAEAAYTSNWFESSAEIARKSAEVMFETLQKVYEPSCLVDVGFGSGGWLKAAVRGGVDLVVGVDGPWNKNEFLGCDVHLWHADLSVGGWSEGLLRKYGPFSLAVCLEVAEHLPESAAAPLVEELSALSDVICFGAAIPGQGGTLHVNEQPQSYWIDLFEQRSFVAFDVFRNELWGSGVVAPYYIQNTFLYVRRDVQLAHDLRAHGLLSSDDQLLVDVVHPVILAQKVESLRQQSVRCRLKRLGLKISALCGRRCR